VKTLRQQVDELLDVWAYLGNYPEVLDVADRIEKTCFDATVIMEPEEIALVCKHPAVTLREDGFFEYERRILIPNYPRYTRGLRSMHKYQMRKGEKPVFLWW
jgi:hypothetical protein